jgi:hypothetical protein
MCTPAGERKTRPHRPDWKIHIRLNPISLDLEPSTVISGHFIPVQPTHHTAHIRDQSGISPFPRLSRADIIPPSILDIHTRCPPMFPFLKIHSFAIHSNALIPGSSWLKGPSSPQHSMKA